MKKMQLKGMTLAEIEAFVVSLGEKHYRAQQLFSWLYRRNASDFGEMTDISLGFRQKLGEAADVRTMTIARLQESASGDTRKYLFRLADDLQIESVLMFDEGRRTLCISSQVGCPIDCTFCATGLMGLKRNLTPGEIIDQVLEVQRQSGVAVTNVVVMGMGEPMLNYDNLMSALDILHDDNGLNIAQKHIVVSTSGLIPAIKRFTDEGRKYRLAISLNATTDEVRDRIIPINRKWPIKDLLQAALDYTRKSRERITFEYVLLAGVNDTVDDARRLRTLLEGIRCKINLIPYNATFRGFHRPVQEAIDRFYAELALLNAPVTVRWSKGVDIDAACGQLVTKTEKSEVGGLQGIETD